MPSLLPAFLVLLLTYSVSSAQNVGIGTATPTTRLQIQGDGTNAPFRVDDQAADTSPFYITAAGNVGIGTATPAAHLEVRNSATDYFQYSPDGNISVYDPESNAGVEVRLGAAWGRPGVYSSNTLNLFSSNSNSLILGIDNVERLRIISTGNVGINNNTPTSRLHVRGEAGSSPFRVDDVSGDSSPFYINPNGNVGVGTASPIAAVHVVQTNLSTLGTLDANQWSANQVGGGGLYTQTFTPTITGSIGRMRIGVGSSGNYTLNIYQGATLLSSQNVTINISMPDNFTFTLPTAVPVVAGTQYRYEISAGSMYFNTSNPYADGESNLGASIDLMFQTFISTPMPGLLVEAGNVGIGNTAPAYKLDVTGTSRFTGAVTMGAFTLPTTDGTANQVLRTNGAGAVSWATAAGESSTASNGLTLSSSDVRLGGTLGAATTIANAGFHFNVTGAGNVGIGNAAPSYKLDVTGTGRFSGALTVGAITLPATDGTANQVLRTNGAGAVSWATVSGESSTASNGLTLSGSDVRLGGTLGAATTIANAGFNLNVTGAGNVGIGNAAPSYKLDVTGTGRFSGALTVGAITLPATDGTANQVLRTNGAGAVSWATVSGESSTASNGLTLSGSDVRLGGTLGAATTIVNAGFNLNVTGAGNMGIGTATPTTRLHIQGDGTNAAFRVDDQTADTSPFYITATGNVGIGTATPSSHLEVRNSATDYFEYSSIGNFSVYDPETNPGVEVRLGAAWGRPGVYCSQSLNLFTSIGNAVVLGIDNTERMRLASTGNVGINTTTPDQLLSVNGNASKVGGGAWAVFSDARLKQNVERFQPGLAELMRLRTVSFEYTPGNPLGINGQGRYVGFLAQEVQQVLPMAVQETESGYLQLNADPIYWTMLNAIQEQQREIEAQRAHIALLQAAQTATPATGANSAEVAQLRTELETMRQQLETLSRLMNAQTAR